MDLLTSIFVHRRYEYDIYKFCQVCLSSFTWWNIFKWITGISCKLCSWFFSPQKNHVEIALCYKTIGQEVSMYCTMVYSYTNMNNRRAEMSQMVIHAAAKTMPCKFRSWLSWYHWHISRASRDRTQKVGLALAMPRISNAHSRVCHINPLNPRWPLTTTYAYLKSR